MAVSILLDEHIRLETAYRLAALGFDVVPLRDRGLLEVTDWALMAWCRAHARAICTRNRADFEQEHQRHRDRGDDHPGILIVERDWSQDVIYWALRQFLEADPEPDQIANQVIELAPATPEFIAERSTDADS
jgi:predicted nuclease of predicted toxin-antitoxin system